MRDNLRQTAPYISIFGLVVLAASLFLRSAASQAPAYLTPGLAVLGAVLLLAWPALRFEDFQASLQGRQARFGGNALVLSVSVIGILAVANYLGHLWYWSWDLTENKKFTISRATVQILDDVDSPVTLTAVMDNQSSRSTLDDLDRLMEQYQSRSDMIEYRHLDPLSDPVRLQALASEVDRSGNALNRSLVAQSGDKNAVVFAFDEQSITEAIVKATRSRDLNVWFTTGHDENALDREYSVVRRGLEAQGYSVEAKNLATVTETLSTDTVQAVVVAGPRQPFLPEEARMLADYVARGGSAMLLLDPLVDATDLGLGSVYLPWGIRARDDAVIDPARPLLGDPLQSVVPGNSLRFHTITKDLLDLQQIVVLPFSRSFGTGTPITTSLTTTTLVESSDRAWGETSLQDLVEGTGDVAADEAEAKGPLAMAIAAEGEAGDGRLVLVGTSQFVSDPYLQRIQGSLNGPLFLNAMNWLTAEEDLITVPSKPPDSRPMSPPGNALLLLVATTLLLPLAVLGVGSWFWWRRR